GVAAPASIPSLRGAKVRTVLRDRSGNLWIGSEGEGLFRVRGSSTRQFTTADGLVNNFIRGIKQFRDGTLWVLTDNGVSHYINGHFENLTVSQGLAYFSTNDILEDQRGDIWIATYRGLTHLQHGSVIQDAATRTLRDTNINSLYETSNGSLWFGTQASGLYRLRAGNLTHLTTKQGLHSNTVQGIAEDPSHWVWIGIKHGISLMRLQDLEAAANGGSPVRARRFMVEGPYGLVSLYRGLQPALAIDKQGRAWVPTNAGLAVLSPNTPRPAQSVRLYLQSVKADGVARPVDAPLRLAANDSTLAIEYATLSLSPHTTLKFAYKLEGFDTDWHHAYSQGLASYTNLPAGHYRFQWRAVDRAHSSPITTLSLDIQKQQHFYTTWWFLGLLAAAIALIAFWLHRLRVRRIHERHDLVLAERKRLAREMHDTLIQGCNGVVLLLDACSEAEAAEHSELLNYARTQLASSVDDARQAVLHLREGEASGLYTHLAALVQRMQTNTVNVECHLLGDDCMFDSKSRHEILMSCREAIYNSLLHANPSRVTLTATSHEATLAVEIEDDGIGFNTESTASEGHFGILGIRERIESLGGKVSIRSQPTGSYVHIAVPLQPQPQLRKEAL
ncbi:MAG: two-component regulator propeller domain-containing protein, partial [Bryocella sp.]